jgi:hypothetical protein
VQNVSFETFITHPKQKNSGSLKVRTQKRCKNAGVVTDHIQYSISTSSLNMSTKIEQKTTLPATKWEILATVPAV